MNRSLQRDASLIPILLALSLACAQEGIPPGGPRDTFPPYIVSTTPETGNTNISSDVSPRFVFNERMDERSVEESLFIAPVIPFQLDANWSGTAFTLLFEQPLLEERTYVITMASGARDVRGNAMTESVVLAVSTGAEIDQGEIAGVVATGGLSVTGAYVWAYNLRTPEDPNPRIRLPDYIGQTGLGGRFKFTNLSPGEYRIFAFLDRARDRRYNAGEDPFAVPTSDVTLTPGQTKVKHRRLELALRHTASLALRSARADHRSRVALRFSKPLDFQNIPKPTSFRIGTQDGGTELPVIMAYPMPLDSSSIVLVTAPQVAGQKYRVTVSGLMDESVNLLSSKSVSASFSGSGEPDVVPPSLVRSVPADSTGDVLLASDVRFTFNEPVRADSAAIVLFDRDGQSIEATLQWVDSLHVRLIPAAALLRDEAYTAQVHTGLVRDRAGNAMNLPETIPDTLKVTFYTVDPQDFGMVTGVVKDEAPDSTGEIFITLTNAEDDGHRYRTVVPSPGMYRFNAMLPGLYLAFAFRDSDGNGRLSHGRSVPFLPAERTTARGDTILVRSGWESEQVDLVFDP